jgi:hypothetical protein
MLAAFVTNKITFKRSVMAEKKGMYVILFAIVFIFFLSLKYMLLVVYVIIKLALHAISSLFY